MDWLTVACWVGGLTVLVIALEALKAYLDKRDQLRALDEIWSTDDLDPSEPY